MGGRVDTEAAQGGEAEKLFHQIFPLMNCMDTSRDAEKRDSSIA